MLRIYRVAAQLVVSRVVLSCTELVSYVDWKEENIIRGIRVYRMNRVSHSMSLM
jgi:hypothetical protein